MVHFCEPTDTTQQLQESYKALGTIMQGIFHVAVVDMSTESGKAIAKEYGNMEAGKILMLGDDKSKGVVYTGGTDYKNLVESLVQVAARVFQDRASRMAGGSSSSSSSSSSIPDRVVQLNAANFKEKVLENPAVVVVAFAAPWCGHCKRLEPEWRKAAAALYGEGAVLGWVDATVDTALGAVYQVSGYPTIKVFPGGTPKASGDAVDYQGERTASAIVKNVLKEVDRSGSPKEIEELVSTKGMQEHCSGANHICVLAALPHIMDSGADGRNKYRDSLATVSKTFRGSSFTFLWFEGTSQPALEQALELTFGFPALVAFSMDREAYAVLHGSFSEKSITSFLHGVTTGRRPTIKLDALPTVETVTPWDGKDAAPIEEEIPLSEIMGWDDDEDEL